MIKLGDKVKDTITGYTGIAVCRCSYLQGCDRVAIQALVDKDNKLPEWKYFDEPQLKVVKKGVAKEGNRRIGGYKPDAAEKV